MPNFAVLRIRKKKFLNAGNKQWDRFMQHDISDGIKYLISENIADPKRVAIYGGSYAVMRHSRGLRSRRALRRRGLLRRTSNIITLLNSIPPTGLP